MKLPFVRSPYNYDTKVASDECGVSPGGESLTVQSMSEDADINVLMKRYGILGKFPDNPFVPQYGDFSQVKDFRSALHAIQDASESFMLYPADFRARFKNDPQLFLDFCENPVNIPEMRKLGLFKESANAIDQSVADARGQVAVSGGAAGAQAGGAKGAVSSASGGDGSSARIVPSAAGG